MAQQDETTIVIGGGLAGLTTAAYLARAGRAVTLIEQHSHFGGAAATQFHNGYAFNRGLHALYSGGPATKVLGELGVPYQYGMPDTVWLQQGNALSRFPATIGALLRTPLLPLRDKIALLRVFATLPTAVPAAFAHVSIADWINDMVDRPGARALLMAVARTSVYSTAIDRVSADVFLARLQQSLKYPVQYVDGGWQILVNGLFQVAHQSGATSMRGERAAALIYDAGRVSGVRLQGGAVLPADAVVLAMRPADVAKLVPATAAPGLHHAIAQLVPAPIACLDVALTRLPDPHHAVVQDLDQPRFLSAQSVYAQIAPAGGALVGAFKQLDPFQPAAAHVAEHDLEQLLDAMQPGWRDVLVKRVFLPHVTACNALPLAAHGGMGSRPSAHVAGFDNLFLAGDWIGPEGFLADASFASARQVAHWLLQVGPRHASNARHVGQEVAYA